MPLPRRYQSILSLHDPDVLNGLVGWWTFDDGSATDVSGYGNNGAFNGGTQIVGGIVPDVGRPGLAVSLNGTTGDVSVANGPVYATSTKPFSVSLWAIIGNPGSAPIIFWLKSDTTTGFGPLASTGSGLWFSDGSGQWTPQKTGVDLSTTAWHHIVLTYNGASPTTAANFLVYVDGVLASLVAATSFSGGGNQTTFGEWGTANSNFLQGSIDDVRIYNRVLSPGEVSTLYNNVFQPIEEVELPALFVSAADDGTLANPALDEGLPDAEEQTFGDIEALALDGFSLTDNATATGQALDEPTESEDGGENVLEAIAVDALVDANIDPQLDEGQAYPELEDVAGELEPLPIDGYFVQTDDGTTIVQARDEGPPDLEDNIEDASEAIPIDALAFIPPVDDGTTIVQALDFPQEDDEQILEIIGIDVPAVALLAAIPILRRKYDYLRRSWNPQKPVEQVGPEAAHTEILTEHYSLNRPDQRFMVLKIKREVAIVETRPKPAPATYTVRAKPRARPPTLEEDEEAVAALLLGN